MAERLNSQAIIETTLKETVSNYRFNSLALYLDMLDRHESVFEAYKAWHPDILTSTEADLGSDCFGLTKILQKKLLKKGIYSSIFAFDTNGLDKDADSITNGVGSVGLFVKKPNDIIILTPGFGLTKPIVFSQLQDSVAMHQNGKTFSFTLMPDNKNGNLSIQSSEQNKNIGFKLQPINSTDLSELQKGYVRIRPSIVIEKVGVSSEREAKLKIDLVKDTITINQQPEIPLSNWQELDIETIAQSLGVDHDLLSWQLTTITRKAGQIRQLWTSGLKTRHYEYNSRSFEKTYHTWPELHQQGFTIGGLVAFITNPRGEIAFYKIPDGKEKQHISRFSGQLNVLVETAQTNKNNLPIEEFDQCLTRGIQEELNTSLDFFKLNPDSYREVPYGEDNRCLARCCTLLLENPDKLANFKFNQAEEGGTWFWLSPEKALGLEIEPNIRPILEEYLRQELI